MVFDSRKAVPQRPAPSWKFTTIRTSSPAHSASSRELCASTTNRRPSAISSASSRSSTSRSSASTLSIPPPSPLPTARTSPEGRSMLRSLKKSSRSPPKTVRAQPFRVLTAIHSAPFLQPAVQSDRPGMNAFTTPSNEPPPAYSETPSPMDAPVRQSTVHSTATDDDPYSFLTVFDTVFLIDDSGSMAGRSWRETEAALEHITPILVDHDEDGIDIHFLNAPDRPFYKHIKQSSTIHEIFSTVRPGGGTPTGLRLNRILKEYLERYSADKANTKPLNIIVITDGVPSDDVESVIISAARKLDSWDADLWQVGIQFFQVGEEAGAREHLQSLDDELSRMEGCRDIVDTVPFVPGARGRGMGLSADGILKVVLGAVNRRLDRCSV